MNTARRATLTAALATTAALTVSGASWGIGTTGPAGASTEVPIAQSAAEPVDIQYGSGRGARRGAGGGGAAANRWSDGSGASAGGADQFRAGRGTGRGGSSGTPTCAEDGPGTAGTGGQRRGGGTGAGPGTGAGHDSGADIPEAVPGATVTDAVAQELVYLVEEEKLAGDVYALAESLHGDRIFSNIGSAEDHHADEVRMLLDRYGLDDPTIGAAAGEFADQSLQALYDQLSSQVRTSRSDAIAAGILIEQTDIADLEDLAGADLPDDVRAVVENLLAGSQRHLAAFLRQAA